MYKKPAMKYPMRLVIIAGLFIPILACATVDGIFDSERDSTKPGLAARLIKPDSEEQAEEKSERPEKKTEEAEMTVEILSDTQKKLVEGAEMLVGKTNIALGDKVFSSDCSGTIRAIYFYAGIDLVSQFGRYTGNGVTRIYKMLEEENLLYDTPFPAPGDLLFWDNTYDRNGDGKWNDMLTHIGMVTEARRDGAIRYVHFHYGANSVIIENMNLLTPNIFKKAVGGKSVIVNAPMRIREKSTEYPLSRGLTSHLYRIFGKGYELAF